MVEGLNINWQRLISALSFYEKKGYKIIDVPWTIREKTSLITKPIGRQDFFVKDKVLVASAEQSFLEMMIDNELEPGKYCAITPCFRDEDVIDFTHQSYFMKVELIDTIEANKSGLDKMMNIAKEFYSSFLDINLLEIGDELYDIIDAKNGIELGSYGTRIDTNLNLKWVFGTGLAEPRLSQVLKLQ